MELPQLIVIAKAPVAGQAKTRLCPPCSPEQAAELAEAALADTLDSVSRTECGGRLLVLEGEPGEWLPEGFQVIPQVGGGLGERLEGAFLNVDGPALLIGMDTPQVTPELLTTALTELERPEADAVFGPCFDGGYWAIGFKVPHPGAFENVPMSTDRTGEFQLDRLEQLGLSVVNLATMRDVDFFTDAELVAAERSDGRFASKYRSMEQDLCQS
ncbi:MAG: TIGR04282 family arsenosugar biosynthesis glycosyltransferase [Solirubrobacterales bacterium]